MFLKLYRTFKAGIQNFYRNGWLSVATISVIVITLFIINVQVAITTANNLLLKDIKDRVSISVYFEPEVTESEVMKARDEFLKYQEVKSIEYISREEAIKQFRERNKDNETIQESLKELGGSNPLGATLNIKAQSPDQYDLITKAVEDSNYQEIISNVNYHKYRNVIESLNREIKSNQRVAIILGITLSIVAVLITFNSIRITMYAYRQEIEIMRLVGASNMYIRFPFVWEGILYGLISAALVVPLIYFYLQFVSGEGSSGSVLPFSNSVYIKEFLNVYFVPKLWIIVLGQLCLGIFLGVVSSMIAIRRYLKV